MKNNNFDYHELRKLLNASSSTPGIVSDITKEDTFKADKMDLARVNQQVNKVLTRRKTVQEKLGRNFQTFFGDHSGVDNATKS